MNLVSGPRGKVAGRVAGRRQIPGSSDHFKVFKDTHREEAP